MDKQKVKEIFNELLELWESNESCVINDRSIDFDKDWETLNEDKQDFIKRFDKALGDDNEN